jgi:NADH-quinone oxidoreductase subunit L
MNFLDLIWLIPLFPLFGSVVMLLIGRRLDPQAPSEVAVAAGVEAAPEGGAHHGQGGGAKFLISLFCPGMVLLSFLLSVAAAVQLSALPEKAHQVIQFTWIAGFPFRAAGGAMARFAADWGFLLDPLSAVMILVVTGVAFVIHVYSIGYMAHDGGYYRFFGYMNLFVFFMLMLVLANNYLLLFVGLGRRRAVQLPADRFLLPQEVGRRRGQEGFHRQPHRRRGLHPGHAPDAVHARHGAIPGRE